MPGPSFSQVELLVRVATDAVTTQPSAVSLEATDGPDGARASNKATRSDCCARGSCERAEWERLGCVCAKCCTCGHQDFTSDEDQPMHVFFVVCCCVGFCCCDRWNKWLAPPCSELTACEVFVLERLFCYHDGTEVAVAPCY